MISCERTVRAAKFSGRLRPLRVGAYPLVLTRKIASDHTPHWSPYPNAFSIIMSDLNICVTEKGSMCGIKPSPTVTRERLPCFIPFFHMPSRLLNLTTLGRTHLSLGRIGLRAWRVKKPMLCLHVVSDADGHLLENENESWRRLGLRIINSKISCGMYRKLLTTFAGSLIGPTLTNFALKEDSALGPDGIPFGACRCSWVLVRNSFFANLF